jgi:drug/metabolite transporter (DMT)-like permease
VLLAIASLRRDPGARPTPRQAVLLAAAGIALAAHFGWWIASLDDTSVAVSTLLVATTPVWTAAYDAFAHRRAPSRRMLAAFVIGAIGLVGVAGFGAYESPARSHPLLGALLALGGAIAMAAYLLMVRDLRGTLTTRTVVTRTYAWAAAVLVVAAALAHQSPPPLAAGAAWAGILGMALISQLLGHTAINAALRWFSPSAVAFSALMEPVSAAVLALIVFGEPLPPAVVAGGALLLGALGLVLSEERPSP